MIANLLPSILKMNDNLSCKLHIDYFSTDKNKNFLLSKKSQISFLQTNNRKQNHVYVAYKRCESSEVHWLTHLMSHFSFERILFPACACYKIGFQIFMEIKNVVYQSLSSQRDLRLPNHWQNLIDSRNTSFYVTLCLGFWLVLERHK